MEVTSKNFNEILKTLPQVISDAQFLSLDTEFTGLHIDGTNYNYFDTLFDLYESLRIRATSFLAVQYGLCAFFYDEENDRYTYKAYNFYVFPSSSKKNFKCQVSCMRFLAEHGLDFGKLFTEGIPYLTDDEFETEMNQVKLKHEKHAQSMESPSPSPRLKDDQKKLIQDILGKIRHFLKNDEDRGSLPRYNSFIRRIIYHKAREKFGDRVILETNKDESMTMIKGMGEEERQKREKERKEAELAAVSDAVGFSKVIKLIMESRKPLIGHNLLNDLLFTINQFLGPLPAGFNEFREIAHEFFPAIFDTKYLAAVKISKETESSLKGILDSFDKDKRVNMTSSPDYGYSENEDRLHEAGYDAYLTGVAFLALAGHVGKLNKTNIHKTLPTSPLLQTYKNKLSVPRMYDIDYLDLEGPYVSPERQTVFHIEFPETWKRDDIISHFKAFGYINIAWIDSTSAYIAVKKDVLNDLKTFMTKNTHDVCKMQTYESFRRTQGTQFAVPISNDVVKSRKRVSSENLDIAATTPTKKPLVFPEPAFT